MIVHPLQLSTGQGRLKIKSGLAWQRFLAGQSPSYHEVVRWLAPSRGYPSVSEDRPLSVLKVEVALGQKKALPSTGWRPCVAFPWCHNGDLEWTQGFQELHHRQEDRGGADKTGAPVCQDVPLFLPVLLES